MKSPFSNGNPLGELLGLGKWCNLESLGEWAGGGKGGLGGAATGGGAGGGGACI